MPTRPIDLFNSLVLTQIEAWNSIDAAVKGIPSMSAARLLALRMLSENPDGLRVTELARRQNISDSAASKLCDRLIKGALITRERSAHDKRVQVVTITPKGKTTLKAALKQAEQAAARFFGHLTEKQQTQLSTLLDLLFQPPQHSLTD